MNPKSVTIKISGSEPEVLESAKRIESFFKLCVRSPLKLNDNGIGVHLFLTAAVELEAQ